MRDPKLTADLFRALVEALDVPLEALRQMEANIDKLARPPGMSRETLTERVQQITTRMIAANKELRGLVDELEASDV